MSSLESEQTRDSPYIRTGQILARGSCAGEVNTLLLGLTEISEPMHERLGHECQLMWRRRSELLRNRRTHTLTY